MSFSFCFELDWTRISEDFSQDFTNLRSRQSSENKWLSHIWALFASVSHWMFILVGYVAEKTCRRQHCRTQFLRHFRSFPNRSEISKPSKKQPKFYLENAKKVKNYKKRKRSCGTVFVCTSWPVSINTVNLQNLNDVISVLLLHSEVNILVWYGWMLVRFRVCGVKYETDE